MKKLIAILLLGALLTLSFVGCNEHPNNDVTTDNTDNTTPPEVTTPNSEVTTPEVTTPPTVTTTTPTQVTTPPTVTTTTPPQVTTVTTPPEITPTYQRPDYLDKIFKTVEADADAYDKLSFSISREDLHFELKNSGLYDNDSWSLSHFEVVITCDYSKATNEEWYKKCSQTDRKLLNEAFYNQYKMNFYGGEFSNILFFDGLYFIYKSVSEFEIDYSMITSFLDLEYVTAIDITYNYGIPHGWMEDG